MENRIFKFRVWDAEGKRMSDSFELDAFGVVFPSGEVLPHQFVIGKSRTSDRFQIMQFTGLKDKNGKEIYEGDIVKWDDQSGGEYWRVAKVYYDNFGRLCYEHLPSTEPREMAGEIWFQGSFAYAEETEKELEIIGNIYENPELLVL